MENITDNDKNKPLGYWLRAIDHLLSREFATAFEAEGVTRREWMLLNVLDGSVDVPGLAERVQRGGKKLRALSDRGWVIQQDGTWTLTDEGRAAKERLAGIADGVRAKVAGAVSPEDFGTMMASLEAIARELGWDESLPLHRGHRGHGRGRGTAGTAVTASVRARGTADTGSATDTPAPRTAPTTAPTVTDRATRTPATANTTTRAVTAQPSAPTSAGSTPASPERTPLTTPEPRHPPLPRFGENTRQHRDPDGFGAVVCSRAGHAQAGGIVKFMTSCVAP